MNANLQDWGIEPWWQSPPIATPQSSMQGGIFGNGIPYSQANGGFGATQSGPTGNGLSQWFNNNQGTVQGVAQGLGAFSSLASLYGMFKQLGLQKDAFKFSQQGTKRNFNAQAQGFNNAVDDQYANRKAVADLRGEDFHNSGVFDKRKIAAWN